VQVRELYGKLFNFVPKFKLIILVNDCFELDGADNAIKRRLKLIKFPNEFVDNPTKSNHRKIDRTLKEKIVSDPEYRIAFLHILLNYYHKFIEKDNGQLIIPERFQNDIDALFGDNDPVQEFIDAKLEITKNNNDRINAKYLFKNFIGYSELKNFKKLQFKECMIKKGVSYIKEETGMFYVGIIFSKSKADFIDSDGECFNENA
jgi:phage/plasmid-associated DNA primase